MLVGFNEGSFSDYVRTIHATGEKSPAFMDLRLSYVQHDGVPKRLLDLLTEVRREQFGDQTSHSNMNFPSPAIEVLGSRLLAAGFGVDFINLFQPERDKLARSLKTGVVDLVAVTTTLYIHPDPIREVVRFVRSESPSVPVVVGGPYINNAYLASASRQDLADLLKYLGADYYVINREGEQALVDLMQALRDGTRPEEVDNLAVCRNGRVHIGSVRPESNDLAANRVDHAFMRTGTQSRFVSTRTAKSCPFSCAFCAFPARSGKYTYMAVADVAQELDAIAELGIDTVTFIDDTFNVPRRRFHDVMRLMISRSYPFRWNCFYRSDHGNDETIDLMRRAGCEGVFLGVESGSDYVLELMNKTARRRHFRRAIPALRRAGISTYASLIIGFPGESEESVEATGSLIEETQPDFYRAQLWYCDPSTPIWSRREEFSIKGRGFNWEHATMDSSEASTVVQSFFPSIGTSIWLPQWGFEQWSVFYLQRLGYPLSAVRELVRDFNTMVGEQVQGLRSDAARTPAYDHFVAVACNHRSAVTM